MAARIYRPAPNAMQAGRGNSKQWVLEFRPAVPREIDPLMGYTSSAETRTQIQLTFDTLEQAIDYARRNGIAYSVLPERKTEPKRNSYADNFRADRKIPWTH